MSAEEVIDEGNKAVREAGPGEAGGPQSEAGQGMAQAATGPADKAPAIPAAPGWFRCTADGALSEFVRADSREQAVDRYRHWHANQGRSLAIVESQACRRPPSGVEALVGVGDQQDPSRVVVLRTCNPRILK